MKPLRVVEAARPDLVREALRNALFHNGPALFPLGPQSLAALPDQVEDDVALVIETSGSTGNPKRMCLSAGALLASARASVEQLGNPGVWWLALPTHYIAGLQVLTRSLVSQTEAIVAPVGVGIVDALESSLEELTRAAEICPLYTSLVPRQLSQLLDAAENSPELREILRAFNRILVGGQSVPSELAERARAMGLKVTRTYGAAETAGGCVWDGKPLPHTGISIIEGRVALSGPMLAGGYLGDSERTARHFLELGDQRWFVTDDLGRFASGILTVTGRADDVIVSGGVKVSLGEVERVVQEGGAGLDAVVVGAPDEVWGEVPVIVSTLDVSLQALRLLVAKRLGEAARPTRVVQVPQIPLLPSGKVDRQAVIELVRTNPN